MSDAVHAAVAVAPGRTEVREFRFPEIAADAGMLKVELTGVCGSDWGYYTRYPQQRGPLILGHETVGHVSHLGRDAAARWNLREGDRIALEEYIPCGHCDYCRSGDFRLCDATELRPGTLRYGSTPVSVAPSLWGGYSQYQYLHPNAVFHRVPEHVPASLAALALPLGNGFEWSYLQGKIAVGETVVIQGPGQQGLACVVAARHAGASRIVVTGLGNPTDTFRLALAKKLGADHTINIEEQDLLETVGEVTGGRMADLVIDCASGGPSTVISALQLARKSGRVILGGQKGQPIPQFPSDLLISKFVTVKGMRGHSYQSVEMALDVIAGGRYPLEELSTHRFTLQQTDEALHTLVGQGRSNPIHCTVDPWT
ncbi:MAG: alcohol dehydrogenase catalytic domain-containing protein [Pseudomonadota bacterium]|nr:alcohol dehydrogenase catalytic domain-containing protein [Pseudomonadota bacterium]